jgi:hypothetical protein
MIQKTKEIIRQIVHYPKLVLEKTNYDDYWVNKRGSNIGLCQRVAKAKG